MAAGSNPFAPLHNDTNNGAFLVDASLIGPGKKALLHNPGISTEWTSEELSKLQNLYNRYASLPSYLRYAKIAQDLNDKTARDVAFCCKQAIEANMKENSKRGKDEHNISKKNKPKKIAASLPKTFQVANSANGHPYAQSTMSIQNDDGISYQAIGGAAKRLLEDNHHTLIQINCNFASFKIYENFNLLCKVQHNLQSILNDFNNKPEIMKNMPPLPIKMNDDELAYSLAQYCRYTGTFDGMYHR